MYTLAQFADIRTTYTLPIEVKQKIHALEKVFPIIPEIWQGHKDAGSGFWEALAYLESIKF
jgi:hypothetical protein